MFSMTSLLSSLPTAALAESDLSRFMDRALGRRLVSDLPGLLALLEEETLSGYPAGIGPIMAAFVERMISESIEPRQLNPDVAEQILMSTAFLKTLEPRVEVERQLLRPGVLLTPAIRDMLERRVQTIIGVGPQLALVAPVEVVHLPDVRWTIPLGPVLARPMSPEEADTLRATWGAVEEAFGKGGGLGRAVRAEFVAVARRPNHDADAVLRAVAPMPQGQRLGLWRAVVAHLRDQEVVVERRPGPRGLTKRLTALGIAADEPWVTAFVGLATFTYQAAALDPDVARGHCPCTAVDLEDYLGWVDVPAAAIKVLDKLTGPEVERRLVQLAALEQGTSDAALDLGLTRPLKALRDRMLAPRHRRARWALDGIDPKVLAESRLAAGFDRGAIEQALRELAAQAEAALAKRPFEPLPPRGVSAEVLVPAEVASSQTTGRELETASMALSPLGAGTPMPAHDVPRYTAPPTASPAGEQVEGVRPARFELPPMPTPPPPRPRPRTKSRTDFPPMPMHQLAKAAVLATVAEPDVRTAAARLETTPARPKPNTARLDRPRTLPPASLVAPPEPSQPPGPMRATPVRKAPAPVAPPIEKAPLSAARARAFTRPAVPDAIKRSTAANRGGSAAHLVTPLQGTEFYKAAFRELESLERDMLQRGPWAAALERIDTLDREAAELASAFGPSARSGDREFSAALRRVERVQDYLERLHTLADQGRPSSDPPAAPKRGGFFKRRR